MIWLVLVVVVWCGCGFLSAGWETAHSRYVFALIEDQQNQASYNFGFAMVAIVLGPIGLLSSLGLHSFGYGWIITRKPLDAKTQRAFLTLNRP